MGCRPPVDRGGPVIGGRHNDPQTPHERARALASDRLDGPLPASEAIWLDEHLAGCDDCRATAAAYAEDRELLRALPVPEPPRDLWARTSVALDRERAGRPGVNSPGPARASVGRHWSGSRPCSSSA